MPRSLDGAFFEHGQLLLQRTEKGVELQRNPWAWTKVSSMMYMEAPAGVGSQ